MTANNVIAIRHDEAFHAETQLNTRTEILTFVSYPFCDMILANLIAKQIQ